jgi:cysteine synthase A
MTHAVDGFVGAIGKTPLIKLLTLSELTGCEIFGKAEFLNPGGSVKDRAALGMILDAEEKGLIGRGGVLVEGTAGNTGIGLTHIANARGYRSLLVVPETQSQEKIDYLRAIGADVRTVPAAPYKDPANYQHVARRLAESIPGAFLANQFDNVANREQHLKTTGPEIWTQTGGKLDAFCSAVGTGGTLGGVAEFLKSKSRHVRTVCADPMGSAMLQYFRGRELVASGSSITEGIGQGRVTKNIEGAPVDLAYRIPDQVIIDMLHFVMRREGLFVGSSSATNLCAAYMIAKELGPGKRIVTVLCDGGARYLSRLWNASWLQSKGLTPPKGDEAFLKAMPAVVAAISV